MQRNHPRESSQSGKIVGSQTGVSNSNEKNHRFIAIERVSPQIDCGRYSVKRIIGDTLRVQADIIKPGHDRIYAQLKHRLVSEAQWNQTPMVYSYDDDRWHSSFQLKELGTYEYCIEASTDHFGTLLDAIEKWAALGEDISADVEEIRKILEVAKNSSTSDKLALITEVASAINGKTDVPRLLERLENPELARIVNQRIKKIDIAISPLFSVVVDPPKSEFSSWYEMFHRSQGTIAGISATFQDCEKRLDDISRMGFDVIYLPPIHPIGTTNRRGANNDLRASPGEPGSPWAIGSLGGGHDAVNRELGTLDDFKRFVYAAKQKEIEIALDLALQCSPDHPYVWQHPEWFRHRKDGTIRYAENPPKRYYDIYPLDFESEKWQELWEELARIVFFWIQNGVRIFRVDNPHTKPIGFWEWLIKKVKSQHPEVIFLAEAFTRPKTMKLLAKAGFTQSYTYFTWKNTKYELTDFLNEFVLSDVSEYYRGNFFTNTPDILHEFLQKGGRTAFQIRLVLAATLSSVYGIYNGFELCENKAKSPGLEEYADSEKYQYKVWDWNRPGNIKDYIERINKIRRENPALHKTANLRIFTASNEHIFFYGKWAEDKSNIIFVAVNLDPFNAHESTVYVPLSELGLSTQDLYTVRDLISGNEYHWKGEANYVRLDPQYQPAHIFTVDIGH